MSQLICQVAVEGALWGFDKAYSYRVPSHLSPSLGCFCMVPFGKGARPRLGIILGFDDVHEVDKLKEILDVCPPEHALSAHEVSLCEFLKEQYLCGFFQAVSAVVPSPFFYKIICKDGEYRLRRRTIRDPKLPTVTPPRTDFNIVLTPPQQKVYDEILPLTGQKDQKPAMLYGVTASGKTAIFIKLIEHVLAQNKAAIMLLPEISLATQMAKRLTELFGDSVALIHSGLSETRRAVFHKGIANGLYRIIVGTRTGIFADVKDLGIIIIDEEQDTSYFSDRTPRFSAINVAAHRAKKENALLLLASATPSISNYYYAKKGLFHLFELNVRYNDVPLPTASLCDLRVHKAKGDPSSISPPMAEEIAKNLADKKQTILLLNRRGYRTVGMCTECNEAKKCRFCSVPMVLHKRRNKLLCHYCGSSEIPDTVRCDKCGGELLFSGVGTEHVEAELARKFPEANVLRLDTDSVTHKDSHEKLLEDFGEGRSDILVGTQMVAKGLDFENVTLVGVLSVDSMLYADSYRAFETVFSLVTQVVGRGGRQDGDGRALIETSDPSHHVLTLAAKQDYKTFYEQEINFRRLSLYPPFCSLVVISFVSKNEKRAEQTALKFRDILTARHAKEFGEKMPLRVLGPAPYHVAIVSNMLRVKLTLKCKNNKLFRDFLRSIMHNLTEKKLDSGVNIFVDFNGQEQ